MLLGTFVMVGGLRVGGGGGVQAEGQCGLPKTFSMAEQRIKKHKELGETPTRQVLFEQHFQHGSALGCFSFRRSSSAASAAGFGLCVERNSEAGQPVSGRHHHFLSYALYFV